MTGAGEPGRRARFVVEGYLTDSVLPGHLALVDVDGAVLLSVDALAQASPLVDVVDAPDELLPAMAVLAGRVSAYVQGGGAVEMLAGLSVGEAAAVLLVTSTIEQVAPGQAAALAALFATSMDVAGESQP